MKNIKINDKVQITFDRKMDKLGLDVLKHIDKTS